MNVANLIWNETVGNKWAISSLQSGTFGLVGVRTDSIGSGISGPHYSWSVVNSQEIDVVNQPTAVGNVFNGTIRSSTVTKTGNLVFPNSTATVSGHLYMIGSIGSGEASSVFTGIGASKAEVGVIFEGGGGTWNPAQAGSKIIEIPKFTDHNGASATACVGPTSLDSIPTTGLQPGTTINLRTVENEVVFYRLIDTSELSGGTIAINGTTYGPTFSNSSDITIPLDNYNSGYIWARQPAVAGSSSSLGTANQTLTGNRDITLSGNTLDIIGNTYTASFSADGNMSTGGLISSGGVVTSTLSVSGGFTDSVAANHVVDGAITFNNSPIFSQAIQHNGYNNAAPVNGDRWYDSNTKRMVSKVNGISLYNDRYMYIGTGGTKVTSSGSVIDMFNHTNDIGTLTIPANAIDRDRILRVHHTAQYYQLGDQNVELLVTLGGNTIGNWTMTSYDQYDTDQEVTLTLLIDIPLLLDGSNFNALANFTGIYARDYVFNGDLYGFANRQTATVSLPRNTAVDLSATFDFQTTGETYHPKTTTVEVI